MARPADCARGLDFDRKLYVARRVFEQSNINTYICSFSSRTIVYKGMFLVGELRRFYLDLQDENPGRYVCLVSKDINLRMKAQAFGVPAQDYLNDKAPDEEELNKRRVGVVRVSDPVIAELYERPEGINPKELKVKPVPNEYFEIGGSGAHIPVFYNPHTRSVVKVESRNVSGISPRNQEQACALDALMRPDFLLVALTGVGGSGLSLFGLGAALAQMVSY